MKKFKFMVDFLILWSNLVLFNPRRGDKTASVISLHTKNLVSLFGL